MSIPFWAWLIWAFVGFVMEIIALYDATPNDTLTATIVNHFPGAWVALAAAWVVTHFTNAEQNKGGQK